MGRRGLGTMTRTVRERLNNSIGLPFRDFFTQERITAVLEALEISFRERIYSPTVTLLTFIAQLMADGSCRAAVSRVVATVAAAGGCPPSQHTGAYCQARNRLSESFFRQMLVQTSQAVDADLSGQELWLGRHRVVVVDGSCAQTPDTPANRREWGLPAGVKPGCGFPVVPFVGFFSLLTGMLVCIVMGRKGAHERALFHEGWRVFSPTDVCLSDRGFNSYVDLAILRGRGVEAVMRLFKRKPDFSQGRSLGEEDHVVSWCKPAVRPDWISREDFEALPDRLEVRELRVKSSIRGWRTREMVVVTTLLDAEVYPKLEIAGLFLRRWEVELDLRHIKTTLGMEMLSTQKPETVRKEIITYMICYNMIRALMWQAGRGAGQDPLRLSFAGCLQHLKSMAPHLGMASDQKEHSRLLGILCKMIAAERLPERPYRFEPRVRKRRPKNYRLMTRPRHVLKKELLHA